jgi:predicted nucleic acid-binding protein
MTTYVLDASALMTFFENRAGAAKVEELLAKAADAERPLAMCVVNWGEVYYSLWRARGEKIARAKLLEIAQLPIEVVDADMQLTEEAASLKGRYNLPYADAFAGALARSRKAALVTSDRDFERVASELNTLWV